ncbi:MAG: methionyl-tRNA formyltransferase [Prevotella sp.]|jgi:methionyl-tRNA formyltransferase|nr:methionyl-tRNA formyltransferase [Prevotella sp.]
MDKRDLRIVFMGTPDFAVESLKALVENGYNVVGVVTMPDKPAGRGHKIQFSAVKNYALEQGLSLLQPEKLKDESFLEELKKWNADLQIVVAFRMLPEVVWNMPPQGTFNLHGSLLPQYRGAAPINWAIINGEKETGVTTFFLTHEIDTGKIILQDKISIGDNDNVGKVYNELMHIGAKLACKTVDMILEGKVDTVDQSQFYTDQRELKAAPKIFKETCRIDWDKSAENIHNHIRGLSPYPAAWTELYIEDKEPQIVKIYTSEVLNDGIDNKPAGYISTDNKTYLYVHCGSGLLSIKEIQFAGKRAMKIGEVLRGYKFEKDAYFK